ncbi:class I SAM-dependent methyltransferase [Thermosediminibacter litoriperuensis]|uniref:Methyltransferase family protein n=1 Tax=Thermosediminibacter litoriperuensis TaxID=291989 RepID=A0A5S5AWC7_9FIRM|nr:class I SAM-dependent methyltransferase [Thermosediminibacter litoriperuensis]TYP57649.1 methyltransferase family protein [Thermosediminibacter litoriperuensis]
MNRSLTESIKYRFERVAPFYDLVAEGLFGNTLRKWRKKLWGRTSGKILEVGVGTGNNMEFYPPGADITAIDFSTVMLKRAKKRAEKLGIAVKIMEMDVQKLQFEDDTFDTVVSTFVFCTVPEPIQGLKELRRVTKPDGTILFLEHVRSERPLAGLLMDFLNPLPRFLIGDNINRKTEENILRSGMKIEYSENLASDIFKMIIASPNKE